MQELMLEYLDGAFRVSFMSEKYECPPEELCALAACHRGTITFMEGDAFISVRNIDEAPESARFANTANGPVPKLAREIVEYGPNDERLRSTVQTRS